MKWRRYLIAGCVGLLVGLIGVSGQQTPHYVQAQADTQEISFQVTPFDEDNPNGLPPYGISAQGMTTSALRVPTSGPSITTLVEVSSDSLTNRKVLASYTANSSDTTSLGNDIPAYYRTISDTDNGIWTRADLAYIYKQHELTDTQSAANLNALDNFNGYWKDLLEASDTGNFDLNRSPYTLDQPKFESLLDEQFDLQTGTVNVPWKKSTANMTVLFKTSDGSTLPNKLEGADGAQVPEPKKDITGYPGEVVNDEAFIPTFTGYTADKSSVTFNADDSQTETVVYITDADLKTTTIHYQYADGTTAAPDAVKYGYKNATGEEPSSTVTSPTITGFTASQASVPVNFDYAGKTADITVTYTKAASGSTGNSAATTDSSSTSSTPDVTANKADEKAPVQKETIYAIKKLGLYRTPNFSKQTRELYYAKRTRTNRPQFVVTGYARSKQGRLRYKVVDVNHDRRTAGKVGYITANDAFTTATYYQSNPKRVKVLRDGVKSYRQVSLKTVGHRYRQGQVLKVKKLVRYHLTTRLLLRNGEYVSANKTLSIKQ